MIPDPVPAASTAELTTHLVSGVIGKCVVCLRGSVRWLDLIAAGGRPARDDSGEHNDHAALHDRCVPGLVALWAGLIEPEDDEHAEPATSRAGTGAARATAPPQIARVPRVGAYAGRPS